MKKSFDVIALGELLIDFTMNGQSEQGNDLFEACPGGAPCNVLAASYQHPDYDKKRTHGHHPEMYVQMQVLY